MQAHWRMHGCRSRYVQSRRSIVVLQSLARMRSCRQNFLQV